MQTTTEIRGSEWAQGTLLACLGKMNQLSENGEPHILAEDHLEQMSADELEQAINDMLSFYAERYEQYKDIIDPEIQTLKDDLEKNGPRGGMTWKAARVGTSIQEMQAGALKRSALLDFSLCTGELEPQQIIEAAKILGISHDVNIVPKALLPNDSQKQEHDAFAYIAG